MEGRTTSDNITKLSDNEVFVFGSNLIGKHGKGAAKTALKFGAKWGQGAGLQGMSYGIPTKGTSMYKTLSIDEIKVFVDEFIQFAKQNKDLTFLVTEIGCGLAGLTPKQVAPLFQEAKDIKNIHLPSKFWHKIK